MEVVLAAEVVLAVGGRDAVVEVGPSWAAPMPNSAARPAQYGSNTSLPRFLTFRLRRAILRHDGGLAASPPVRYTLRVARSG